MKERSLFIRRIGTENYLETFLISAVTAVLLIRLFLRLTSYPQLGGADLHIAHMLWGGLLMMAALIFAFSFIGQKILRLISILGGIGFGTFIDEIGKFVSHDNDYFFQPSVALIYITLVLVFLTVRSLFRKNPLSKKEYLLNAIERIEEVASSEWREDQKIKTLSYLKKCDLANLLVRSLTDWVNRIHAAPHTRPSIFFLLEHKLRNWYHRKARKPGFETAIVLFFLFQLLMTLMTTSVLVFFHGLGMEEILESRILGGMAAKFALLSFADWAELVSSWLSAVFVLLGIIRIRATRFGAFRMFERSMLVTIFLTQIFTFYREQFSAIIGLFINTLVWIGLRYVMEQEGLKWQKRLEAVDYSGR